MKSNLGRAALLTMSLICIFLLAACGSSTPVLRYITITPAGSTIATGTTLQFTATGYYSNGAITPGITVSWSSSNTAVATINGTTGIATGVASGTTTITATALGITSGTTTLTVAGLSSIAVTPATTGISVGATQQYDAVATYTTSTGMTGTEDVTAQATWTSSNTAIATMSTSTPGLATAVAAGSTTITAAVGSVSGSATLNVTAAVSLVVSPLVTPTPPPTSYSMGVGTTFPLVVQEKWADGSLHPPSATVTWTSSAVTEANVVPNGAAQAIVAAFTPSGSTPVTIAAAEGTVTGTLPITVVTGSTLFAYVANSASNSISSYTVTAATAPYLAPLATTPQNVTAFTFLNPNGSNLYEIDQASNLWVYNVNSSSGAITQATGITQPVVAGVQGDNFGAVDPYGRFIYVTDDGVASSTYPQGTIYGFTIDQTTGALTPIAAVTAFTTNLNVPQSIVIDHTGSYLYVTNFGTGTTPGTISAYSIDQTTGNLTPLSTATYATGNGPVYATIDPTGTYLYVPNSGDTPTNTVSAFSIGAGGALTPLASPTRAITGSSDVINVAVSPNGSYLYVLDAGSGGNGQVFAYTLAAGVPSVNPISGTPIATGVSPTGMAIDPTSSLLAVDNIGTTTGASTISLFTIGSTGALTSQTAVATQDSPRFIVFYNGL
jgi:6-phosphogluconolactonase (cycloisomerase 2 family)